MEKLSLKEIKDKILGCWEGKNIGGVLGAPFEMYRGTVDVNFYTQDLTKGIPANDDLDLQLIWLNACEKYGKSVNTDILSEYWVSYQIDNSNEYGTALENLRSGLVSPLSGVVGNPYRNSNGAFIRSEIWACLFPGNPYNAVKYCYEDAIVDHSDEGLYAAVFCTVLESVAFLEKDVYRLVEIAKSYIPIQSAIYQVIDRVQKMHVDKCSIDEIREMLLTDYPSYFGIFNKHPWELKENFPLGEIGFDAPVQIGIIVASLLIGNGNFEKTIITAVYCGEDADCTAATCGAILGIINGASNIPEKWKKPLGHNIETVCINRRRCLNIPSTTDELTERVIRLLPVFNDEKTCLMDETGFFIVAEEPDVYDTRDQYFIGNYGMEPAKITELITRAPFKKLYHNFVFDVLVDYKKEPFIKVGETVLLDVTVFNNNTDWAKHTINVKVFSDDDIDIKTGKFMRDIVANNYETKGEFHIEFAVNESCKPYIDLYLDITSESRPTSELIKCRYFFV